MDFQIDDGGGMFDCSPEGVRMEGEGLQSSRRFAVAYLFEHVHDNPSESEWQGRGGVLGKVMRRLDIPRTPCTVFARSSRMSLNRLRTKIPMTRILAPLSVVSAGEKSNSIHPQPSLSRQVMTPVIDEHKCFRWHLS